MSLSALENAYNIAAYMRVTSLAIAGFDYIQTIPTVWGFYLEHFRSRRLSVSVVLFALLRFTSVNVLIISNVGFFYSSFTQETCGRFYLLSPAFKVIQTMVTQAILAVRAFNLSRRSRVVGWSLLALYIAACALQWVTTLIQRTPQVGKPHANCRGATHAKYLGAYIFYAIAIIYDTITTAVSVFYLFKYRCTTKNSLMSKLTKMMLYDGLGYLVALTGINVLNVILYTTYADIQTAGASLSYSVSWIMCHRLLIHLYDASRARREEESFEGAFTVGKDITDARNISQAVRTFGCRSNKPFGLTPDSRTEERHPEDNGVQVRIERTVLKMERFSKPYELEDYSRRTQSPY